MDERQINLHRQIRQKVNFREKQPVRPSEKQINARKRIDELLAKLPDGETTKELRKYVYYERTLGVRFVDLPPWLIELSEKLQVITDSNGDDPYRNAVQAIKLLLKRSVTNEKKLIGIRRIIGDIHE